MHLEQIHNIPLALACQCLLKKLNLSEQILTIQRFLDENLHKTYDTYLITTTTLRKFIIKRTPDTQERDMYTKILLDPSFHIPKYYGDFTQSESQGEFIYMLMEYIPGNDLRNANLDTLRDAVKNIATIHSHFLGTEPPVLLKFDFNKKLHLLNRDYIALNSLPKEPFKKFATMYSLYIQRVLEAPKTLVNNDLLPINILTRDAHTYLIDWSYAHYSPYMLDMARLTGHHDQNHSWFIPKEYHATLERLYFSQMKNNTAFQTSYTQYLLDLKLSKFKERVSYLIWCIRNPNQPPDEAFYQLDLEQCELLTKDVIG